MKNTIAITTLIGGLTLAATTARAFDSGSDGSYGPINITNNTLLPMPPNGIFHCTTITVASSATLKFTPNSLNTPVYLLAQGDIIINGVIDVSGQNGQLNASYSAGGPGGYEGGSPTGAGRGPSRYGYQGNELLVPLLGGSGGDGFNGWTGYGSPYIYVSGGGGGGAVLVSSSSAVRLTGTIRALGGAAYISGWTSPGRGGGIRVVAPVVSGSGTLDVSSNGRARIDCPPQTVSINMVGGTMRIGKSMFISPPNSPRLYFVNAAGQAVDPSTLSAVNINLPAAGNTVQEFTVRGENFLGDVPVTAVAIPENGAGSTNSFVMHFPTDVFTNVSVSFTLTLATNQNTYINAYARYGVQP
jgi:hypothetical protein